MIAFFKWLGRVFTGWWNVIIDKQTPEFKKRLEICMECKDKVKIGKSWWCSRCGCEIHAKTKSPKEKCLNGKW